MKKALKTFVTWIKQLFTRNMGMKIGALVFAFLMWSFVQAEQNPDRIKEFSNITVTYNSADVLKQRGLTSAVPFSEILKSVSVQVQTKSDRSYLVTSDTVSADVDLSAISEPGEYTLPVRGSTSIAGSNVQMVTPSEVTVTVEAIVAQNIPVEVRLTGEKQEGLFYGEPVLEQKTVEITGARSNVDQVAKAVCEIDLNTVNAPVKENRPVILMDKNGQELPSNMFTNSPSVIVDMSVYPKKSVPVVLEGLEENITGIADGYEIKSVEVSQKTVDIAGRAEVIKDIQSVGLDKIVLDSASKSQTVNVKVLLPEGAYAVSPERVEVAIKITPILVESNYPAVDIAVKNLGDGLETALFPGSIDIVVKGTKEKLDHFTADLLKPFVDVQDKKPGVYSLEVKFENEPDLSVTLQPSVRNIAVTISKAESGG